MEENQATGSAAPARPLGWLIHALLLGLYPLLIGLIGWRAGAEGGGPMLPAKSGALLVALAFELSVFGLVFALAWLASRASPAQLLLGWHGGARPLWLGLGYSIALRGALLLALLLLTLAAALLSGGDFDAAGIFQPQTERVVDADALLGSPAYLLINLTLVSFVLAGFREELWRAGMLAALAVLFPRSHASRYGRAAAVALVALLFGLGHAVQGAGGVLLTTLLGLGLGAMMLYHRSIWPAVLAHGFFNATSFALLYLVARSGVHNAPW